MRPSALLWAGGLAVVLAPVLAVMIVGGYGFLVWMFQIIAGPPGTLLR